MSLSIIVCEGVRDRVVIARILEQRHGWSAATPRQAKAAFNGPPFQHSAGPRALLYRDERPLVIMERSKGEPQRAALAALAKHRKQWPSGESWDKLLLVLDADGLDLATAGVDLALAMRQHVGALFAPYAPEASPLDGWVEAVLHIDGTEPPEARRVTLRAHVLPALGEPGCLETALLQAVSGLTHAALVGHLRQAVTTAKPLKEEYLRGRSDLEKATAGAVLSVLEPDLHYTDLERRYRELDWPIFERLAEVMPGLADL